ncbi:hypothetical protein ACCO45_002057 [Purpureocillium lilacinum]|uniref:Uncharacterized protein n=1 Tax=Purpureocillium lilacinum TaxID=33203 RepID=A0ACC4E9N2_PURLI
MADTASAVRRSHAAPMRSPLDAATRPPPCRRTWCLGEPPQLTSQEEAVALRKLDGSGQAMVQQTRRSQSECFGCERVLGWPFRAQAKGLQY